MGNKIPRGVFEIHLYSIAYPRTDSLFGERLYPYYLTVNRKDLKLHRDLPKNHVPVVSAIPVVLVKLIMEKAEGGGHAFKDRLIQ